MSESVRNESSESPPWKPIGRHQRRVLGVLVEKAKTTPDNYPMSIAALVAGANQKSNRSPQMQLDEDEVADALESLRSCGAVREIQGSGRVNKYRHLAYEWLGVNSPQAAVMTELLLRGPQTAGELRSRASRMEPFSDLDALGATLDELEAQGLVIPLTPRGRGQIFTHALYEPDELRRLRAEAGGMEEAAGGGVSGPQQMERSQAETHGNPPRQEPVPSDQGRDPTAGGGQASPNAAAREPLRDELGERFRALEAEVQQLRDRVGRLEREFGLEQS